MLNDGPRAECFDNAMVRGHVVYIDSSFSLSLPLWQELLQSMMHHLAIQTMEAAVQLPAVPSLEASVDSYCVKYCTHALSPAQVAGWEIMVVHGRWSCNRCRMH